MRSFRQPAPGELPPGFEYRSDFITPEEEQRLLETIRGLQFRAFDLQGYTARRRGVEYGFEYDFSSRQAARAQPIADFLLPLRQKAAEFARVAASDVQEAIITEYPPGAPMGWRRDVKQFEVVIGVSLAGSCFMRLKPYHAAGERVIIKLEPRSVYVMRDEARWQYQHSIRPVERLRYSITFRTLRAGERAKVG